MAGTSKQQADVLRCLFGDDPDKAVATDTSDLPVPFEVTDDVGALLEDQVVERIREFIQDPEGFTDGIANRELKAKLLELRRPTLEIHGGNTAPDDSTDDQSSDDADGGVVEGGNPPKRASNGSRSHGRDDDKSGPPAPPKRVTGTLLDLGALMAEPVPPRPEPDPEPVDDADTEEKASPVRPVRARPTTRRRLPAPIPVAAPPLPAPVNPTVPAKDKPSRWIWVIGGGAAIAIAGILVPMGLAIWSLVTSLF